MKKSFVILLAACIVVASIATISLASYELLAFGLQHGGSGGRVYEQSYAKVHAINESCTVTLSVRKGDNYYGSKVTVVGPNRTDWCYSYQVSGTGGYEAITFS